ncbi:hypothetical protein LI003_23660, partial [Bacteroides caccae]|uniref:hypothetical protein n=1 Tax=Bacteroides caccae TaxID=47678 RepID=UPI001D05E1AD
TVSSGATLEGTGTINAPTTVVGTLAVQIGPSAAAHGHLTSTSTVDLTGATVEVVPDAGMYTAGTEYTLLTGTAIT